MRYQLAGGAPGPVSAFPCGFRSLSCPEFRPDCASNVPSASAADLASLAIQPHRNQSLAGHPAYMGKRNPVQASRACPTVLSSRERGSKGPTGGSLRGSVSPSTRQSLRRHLNRRKRERASARVSGRPICYPDWRCRRGRGDPQWKSTTAKEVTLTKRFCSSRAAVIGLALGALWQPQPLALRAAIKRRFGRSRSMEARLFDRLGSGRQPRGARIHESGVRAEGGVEGGGPGISEGSTRKSKTGRRTRAVTHE